MYRTVADFLADWKHEAAGTDKLFAVMTDAHLTAPQAPGVRTLGRMAWHITQTLTEMGHKAGLFDADALDGHDIPTTVDALRQAYTHHAQAVADAAARWTDDSLTQTENMYGEQWARGTILHILLVHQTHHRAEMLVLLRQAGVAVPGLYGPAAEEWAAWNMPAMP